MIDRKTGDGDPPNRSAGSGAAVSRAARNTSLRAAAELIGKLLTLVLLAVLARMEGPVALGVLVFGLAWSEIASFPIDMGFDRHMQRLIARDHSWLDKSFWNVLTMKARRAVPVVPASLLLLWLLGYNGETRSVVALLTATYLAESIRWTLFAVFTAFERADLVAKTLLLQRFLSGGLGLGALALGLGVVGVAAAYAIAAVVAVVGAIRLLHRHVSKPRRELPEGPRGVLRKGSLPFATQEFLAAGIARVDTVLLSLLTSQAIVGLYGSAYRLLEATLFVSTALLGAVSAMFTYLDDESDPTVGSAFSRSVKLSVALLLPCALVFAVLPEQIIELLFGSQFTTAAPALRLLAPVVVLLGIVMLSGSLIASRLDPKFMVTSFAVGFSVNIAANLALIPPFEATGAALAMLLTELVLVAIMLPFAARAVGWPPFGATVGSSLVAGGFMALALVLLSGSLLVALLAGSAIYVSLFIVLERRIAPADLEALAGLIRGKRLAGEG